MNKYPKKTAVIILLLNALMLPGCMISRTVVPERGHYYVDPHVDFTCVGKVVVFELDNRTNSSDIEINLTKAIANGLEKKHIFSVKTLTKTDPQWTNLDLEQVDNYTFQELMDIRNLLNADAVMYGTITEHNPYPHMSMGMHLKLIDLHSGDLLWAFEQVWDTSDKRVECRMKMFYDGNMREGYEPLNWRLFISSPKAFNKFVVQEVAQTFPDGNPFLRANGGVQNSENIKIRSRGIERTLEIPVKMMKLM